MAQHWYVIHVYSGFEKKVAESIREQADAKGMGDLFAEVLVPTEEVVEMRRGTKVQSERKFLPGYVLVKMDLTDETWHLVKNTPKVTGFLGSGQRPAPVPHSVLQPHNSPAPPAQPHPRRAGIAWQPPHRRRLDRPCVGRS